ncbi:hypothetical protein [Rhodopseudomonas pseudopalustris]|nr:hypothetical protein [Rhodopseudomonas pseudopalustris]
MTTELRTRARLAWAGWPDTAYTREILAASGCSDPVFAAAWDRVVAVIIGAARSMGLQQKPVGYQIVGPSGVASKTIVNRSLREAVERRGGKLRPLYAALDAEAGSTATLAHEAVWGMLGVTNHADAVLKLKRLMEETRRFARIAAIDEKFDTATDWGSWMVGAANEREQHVKKLRAAGYTISHRHQARTSSGERVS